MKKINWVGAVSGKATIEEIKKNLISTFGRKSIRFKKNGTIEKEFSVPGGYNADNLVGSVWDRATSLRLQKEDFKEYLGRDKAKDPEIHEYWVRVSVTEYDQITDDCAPVQYSVYIDG